jgi:hypothetical protein
LKGDEGLKKSKTFKYRKNVTGKTEKKKKTEKRKEVGTTAALRASDRRSASDAAQEIASRYWRTQNPSPLTQRPVMILTLYPIIILP